MMNGQKNFLLLLTLTLGGACAPAPERVTVGKEKDADAQRGNPRGSSEPNVSPVPQGENPAANPMPEAQPAVGPQPQIQPQPQVNPTPSATPNPMPGMPANPSPMPVNPTPMPQMPPVSPMPAMPPMPPMMEGPKTPKGCEGASEIGAKDLLIFDGKALQVQGNKIPLNADWILDDVWGNGKLGVESKNEQSVLTFSGESIYHGFKISPQDRKKNFVAGGVDFYLSASKNGASFGLRIIKPGEFEGNGGAPTTSWYKLDAQSNKAENKGDNAEMSMGCKLIRFYVPKTFLQENKQSTRLIWEMMTNWSPNDKLFIHRIVLRDFSWK